ncbi:MAG: hypothetical protein V1818_01875 [Candidatus Aenigmatarchaeota archaeon]
MANEKNFQPTSEEIERSFKALGKALDNKTPLEKFFSGYKSIGLPFNYGDKSVITSVYEMGRGVTIVRERHMASGMNHRMIRSGRNPEYSNEPFSWDISNYYVLNGNKLVIDEEEVKQILKDSTAIDMPVIEVRNEPRPNTLHRNFNPGMIVTKVTVDEKNSYNPSYDEFHKEERYMRSEIKSKVRKTIEDGRSTGFIDVEREEKLSKVTEIMYPGMFKEILDEMKPDEDITHPFRSVFGF